MVDSAEDSMSEAVDPGSVATPLERHVLSVVMLNQPAVLAHVCSSLGSRDYNIVCMAVGPDPDSRYSRVTILLAGDGERIELARKRLECLVNVMRAENVTTTERATRLEGTINGVLDNLDT